MIATTITAIARMIPTSCAIFASWRQVDEPDVRVGNRERCVSDFTLRRLSKKMERWPKDPMGTGQGPSAPPSRVIPVSLLTEHDGLIPYSSSFASAALLSDCIPRACCWLTLTNDPPG